MKLKDHKKSFIRFWLVVIFIGLPVMLSAVITGQVIYARNITVEGTVISVDRTTRGLPIFVVRNNVGQRIIISNGSVALTFDDIKVGDSLVKRAVGDYCLINGEKVLFSKYRGSDSYVDIFSYFFRNFQ